ncbi:MAG: hypothetical protein H7Y31_13165 [Chitinophagaceae bacterium]|nr:hypothetical protein [Chitinophagaceae bacterium]
MKLFRFFIWLMPVIGYSQANAAEDPDSVRVTITLNNGRNSSAKVDSVLVIFDRYNGSGAGVVRRVFYPINNTITIENVPEGRFYINVICLGIYQDNFSDISYVYQKKKNRNRFSFRLERAEPFEADNVNLPSQKFDMRQLAILRKIPMNQR